MVEDKQYYIGLDFLKIILATIVVLRHACQNFLEPSSIFYIINVNVLSPCAVPCFFIISGFLFFSRKTNIKKQILRLLIIYIAWSIIYFPFFLISHKHSEIFNNIQELIFIGSFYHIWFLPALIVALLINYFLRKLNNTILFVFFLFLFVIAVLAEPYRFLIADTIISQLFSNYEKVFLTFRNGVFLGLIYVFIGKQIAIYDKTRLSISKLVILFFVSLILLFIEGFTLNKFCHYSVVNILLTCLLFSTILFLLFLFPNKNQTNISLIIRNISTFIFCSHPLIIIVVLRLLKIIQFNRPGEAIVITLILSFLISWLAVVLSKQKIFKWIKLFY